MERRNINWFLGGNVLIILRNVGLTVIEGYLEEVEKCFSFFGGC